MTVKSFVKTMICAIGPHVQRLQRNSLPGRILFAYRMGKFPMTSKFGLVAWHSPERRAIIPLDDRFQVGKRLRKRIDSHVFEVTFDTAFSAVLEACAEARPERGDAWLSPELAAAYLQLHRLGHAHSVEVWHDGRLVGGEYGVAIDGFYSGESAFTREDYAGRVAMVFLVKRLRERGFTLLDSQYMSPLAREFGGFEVDRDEYNRLLAEALGKKADFA